jgi:hypothetical protein
MANRNTNATQAARAKRAAIARAARRRDRRDRVLSYVALACCLLTVAVLGTRAVQVSLATPIVAPRAIAHGIVAQPGMYARYNGATECRMVGQSQVSCNNGYTGPQ